MPPVVLGTHGCDEAGALPRGVLAKIAAPRKLSSFVTFHQPPRPSLNPPKTPQRAPQLSGAAGTARAPLAANSHLSPPDADMQDPCRMAGRFGPNALIAIAICLLDIGAFFVLVRPKPR